MSTEPKTETSDTPRTPLIEALDAHSESWESTGCRCSCGWSTKMSDHHASWLRHFERKVWSALRGAGNTPAPPPDHAHLHIGTAPRVTADPDWSCLGCGQATGHFVTGSLVHPEIGLCRTCVERIRGNTPAQEPLQALADGWERAAGATEAIRRKATSGYREVAATVLRKCATDLRAALSGVPVEPRPEREARFAAALVLLFDATQPGSLLTVETVVPIVEDAAFEARAFMSEPLVVVPVEPRPPDVTKEQVDDYLAGLATSYGSPVEPPATPGLREALDAARKASSLTIEYLRESRGRDLIREGQIEMHREVIRRVDAALSGPPTEGEKP